MRKLAIAATAAVFAFAAAAQQPQQCVNPDTVNGLIFLGRSDMKITVTRALPAFMNGFRAPTGFSLIGSGLRDRGITAVAYKTSLTSEKAYTALLAAFGAEGWAIESPPGAAATFNVAGGPKEGTVCRNGERRTVMVTEYAGTRYVTIYTFATQARQRDCNAPDPGMEMAFEAGGRHAPPRFQFPAGTSLAYGGGGIGGGSNTLYSTSSRIISAETPAALVEHLASQLAGQGWHQDANWSGSGSAGSTWRKNNDDEFIWGTLEIIRVSEGTYDVDFTQALPQ